MLELAFSHKTLYQGQIFGFIICEKRVKIGFHPLPHFFITSWAEKGRRRKYWQSHLMSIGRGKSLVESLELFIMVAELPEI